MPITSKEEQSLIRLVLALVARIDPDPGSTRLTDEDMSIVYGHDQAVLQELLDKDNATECPS